MKSRPAPQEEMMNVSESTSPPAQSTADDSLDLWPVLALLVYPEGRKILIVRARSRGLSHLEKSATLTR